MHYERNLKTDAASRLPILAPPTRHRSIWERWGIDPVSTAIWCASALFCIAFWLTAAWIGWNALIRAAALSNGIN